MLAVLVFALALSSPADTITGVVRSEGGNPIANARVTLARTRSAAITDNAGRYRIITPSESMGGADTLRVERIGYASAALPVQLVNGAVRIDVSLELQPVALDEIVVTGTAGNQQRRAQAAVVAAVDAADVLARAPVANVMQVLQARVPGLVITETSGMSGSSARINVRGAASISLSNQPLVFLDGIRIDGGSRGLVNVSGAGSVGQAPSALNDLNPSDIESIEIVKGPAAATLYGADASAGVIQIITKKGQLGNRTFTQEILIEYDRITPHFTVPTNFARCVATVVGPDSTNPLCRGRQVGALISDNPAERIDAFRDGWSGTVRYQGRGGGENYGFFASFGFANEQGTTRNNELEQHTGRLNFTVMPASTLTFDASFAISRTEHDLPRSDQDAYGYYVQSVLGSPLTVRDAGAGVFAGGLLFGTSSLESLSSVVSRVSALRTTPTVQVRFAPSPSFVSRLTVGADLIRGRGFQHFPKNDLGWYPGRLSAGNGDVTTTQDDDRTYTIDYLGTVETAFGSQGAITSYLSFGSQYIHRVTDRLSGFGAGLATNAAYLVTNAAVSTVGQEFAETKSQGLFVQEQLGWRERAFLQVGLRADRNSAFGAEVGTFYLPKVGVSWVVSEESFWRAYRSLVPTLRLRGAWGTTGRSPTSGASLRTYQTARFVTDAGQLELGVAPGNPGNPDLKPERGEELEIGFDAGFLDGRFGAEITWFAKTSKDLLVSIPVSPSSGFGTNPLGNIGEVRNRGLEFSLTATPISSAALGLDLSLTGSTLHNEITSLGTSGAFINNFRAFVPGRQIAAWWVHRIRSVDQAQGRVTVSDTAEFAGNQLPSFQANAAFGLRTIHAVRVHALFEHKAGYVVYNATQEFRDRSARTAADVVLSQEEGGYATRERLVRLGPYVSERTGRAVGAANVKEAYLQKGDHVRFRELTLSMPLPSWLVRRARIGDATLSVGARNLALWSAEYEGHDPDVLGTGADAGGLNQLFSADVFTTPPTRRWVVRLNARF